MNLDNNDDVDDDDLSNETSSVIKEAFDPSRIALNGIVHPDYNVTIPIEKQIIPPFKVLITHPDVPKIATKLLNGFCSLYIYPLTYFDEKSFIHYAQGMDGILIHDNNFVIDNNILEKINKLDLKVISTMTTDTEHLDVKLLHSNNIKIGYINPDILSNCVAEVAIGLALNVAHRLTEGYNKIRKGELEYSNPLFGTELNESIIGIIGLGRVGRAIVKRLKYFNAEKIIFTDRKKRKSSSTALNIHQVNFDTLLRDSDFIFITCSPIKENRDMFHKKIFYELKNETILINVSKGHIIRKRDLICALENGFLNGVGIDACDPELIPPYHKLLDSDNCLITPNIGICGARTKKEVAELAALNITAALTDQQMPYEHHLEVESETKSEEVEHEELQKEEISENMEKEEEEEEEEEEEINENEIQLEDDVISPTTADNINEKDYELNEEPIFSKLIPHNLTDLLIERLKLARILEIEWQCERAAKRQEALNILIKAREEFKLKNKEFKIQTTKKIIEQNDENEVDKNESFDN